ncbi:hypothetical protein LEMLEM_LOCUS4677 [Lemmus lemmus]
MGSINAVKASSSTVNAGSNVKTAKAPRAVGATSFTAAKTAPGAAPSMSAERCKASAWPQTSSTVTSNCSVLMAMP